MSRRFVNCFWSAALLTCAVFLGWAGVAQSQTDPRLWTNPLSPDLNRNGVMIREGHHVEWQRASYRRSDGYVLVAWSDCRTGDRDVYGQLIAPDGHEVWQANGRPIITYRDRQEDPEVVAVDGGWVIAWIDFRFDTTGDVFAQKITDSGTRLWDTTGALVDTFICRTEGCNCAVLETTLRAVSDGSGGAIIAWEDTREDPAGNIMAQRVDASGHKVWTGGQYDARRIVWQPHDQSGITADGDGNGNMLVAWFDKRNPDDQDIYAAKVMPDGTMPWGTDGRVVCSAPGAQKSPRLCPDGSGGCYIAWVDPRGADDDIYMQRMNGNGDTLWAANDIPLVIQPYIQLSVRVAASMNGNVQDGVLAVWDDKRVNGERAEIYAQKLSPTGTPVWEANGLFICGNAGHDTLGSTGETREGSRLTSDLAGGSIIAWEDTRNSGGELLQADLYAARVLANGTLPWGSGPCGVLLADGPRAQNQPLVRTIDSNAFCVFWDDNRTGSQRVKYQKYSMVSATPLMSSDSTLVYGLDQDATRPLAVSMSAGRVGVVWQDNRAVGTALYYQVVDSMGHLERTLNGDTLVPDNEGHAQISQEKHEVCPDDNGGFFVTFEDLRTGAKRIRLAHVNSDGGLACGRAAVEVFSDAETTDQVDAYVAPDGQGGCYVAWSNYNQAYLIDVYIMRMTSECTPAWAQPVRLTNTGDDDMMRGVVSNPDGAICVWKTGGFGAFDIATAKVTLAGDTVFNFNICDATDEQDNPALAADGEGGAYYVWSDKRNAELRPGFDKDIYAQHLDAQGHETWGAHNGIPVVMDTLLQDNPQITEGSDGAVYCTWETFVAVTDTTSNLDLRAQKLTSGGTRVWPVLGKALCTAHADQADAVLYAEWGNGLWVAWTDKRSPFPDIYGTHLGPDGNPSYNWWVPDSGGVICNYYQYQVTPSIAHDGNGGVFCAWEDRRASGKEPLKNIWMNRVNDFRTSIKEIPSAAIPTKPELYQNYPNPFNPSTRITFAIPATQRVTVEVFNTLGQQVATLVDKVMVAGKYEILFDSPRLASGMYYYRLKAHNFVDVKKMLLLK